MRTSGEPFIGTGTNPGLERARYIVAKRLLVNDCEPPRRGAAACAKARLLLVTKSPRETGPLPWSLQGTALTQTARQRRTKAVVAIGASAVLHVGLLIGLLVYRPVLFIPVEPAGPPEAIIPILLMPRTPPAAAGSAPRGEFRLHRRAPRFGALPPEVTPLVTNTPVAAAPTTAPATTTATAPAAAGPDLRAALRYGAGGCANRATLSRNDRDVCDERFGKAARDGEFIPPGLGMSPAKRAMLDQAAAAKEAYTAYKEREVPPAMIKPEPPDYDGEAYTSGAGASALGPITHRPSTRAARKLGRLPP